MPSEMPCEMRKRCNARVLTKMQDGENMIDKKIKTHNHSSTSAKVEARSAIIKTSTFANSLMT